MDFLIAVIYLIGAIVALYIIGNNISKVYDDREDVSGAVIGYLASLFSWLTVLVCIVCMYRQKILKVIR